MIQRTIFSEEHEILRNALKKFIDKELKPHHKLWESNGMVDKEVWKKAGEYGFLCMSMPHEFGGSGLDFSFIALMIEELAKEGMTGPGFCFHSEIVAPYIFQLGNKHQKEKYLPAMANGSMIGALAMTEASGGSDLKSIKTTAIKQGDTYILNGSKIYITNGYICDFVIVMAKTNLKNEQQGISLFLVDANLPGVGKGKPHKKLGLNAQDNCELFFDHVELPASAILGEENQGLYSLVHQLSQERLIVGLICIETANECLNRTIAYAKNREVFGKTVFDFQHNAFKIAEMHTKIQMGRIFTDKCLELFLNDELDMKTSSMLKFSMSDLACEVADTCLQMHGAYGYMDDNFVGKAFVDMRAYKILSGTNEIMKEIISKHLSY